MTQDHLADPPPCAIRQRVIERWLSAARPGDQMVYHRGELYRDKLRDPDLAAAAQRMLELSTGRFAIISKCGHERGLLVGSRTVELVTRRERGELVYMARRL
jgi:hypothetical protein